MDIKQAIDTRHSIRQFIDQPIASSAATELQALVEECNERSGLHMQLILSDSKAMSGLRSLVLKNASNYLAIVGKVEERLDELGGYWGEKVVLAATQLRLGSCWFAMGAKKDLVEIAPGEKMLIVVALGYAAKEGTPHTSKPLEKLYQIAGEQAPPEWFLDGVKAAQLAPTARNQQKFRFTLLSNGNVRAESLGGPFSGIDLGIVKCHFEIGAEPRPFKWG